MYDIDEFLCASEDDSDVPTFNLQRCAPLLYRFQVLEEHRMNSAASFLKTHCPDHLMPSYESRPTWSIRMFLKENLGYCGWRQDARLLDRLQNGQSFEEKRVDLARLLEGGLCRADKSDLWGVPLRDRVDADEALKEYEPDVFKQLEKMREQDKNPDKTRPMIKFKNFMGDDLIVERPPWLIGCVIPEADESSDDQAPLASLVPTKVSRRRYSDIGKNDHLMSDAAIEVEERAAYAALWRKRVPKDQISLHKEELKKEAATKKTIASMDMAVFAAQQELKAYHANDPEDDIPLTRLALNSSSSTWYCASSTSAPFWPEERN